MTISGKDGRGPGELRTKPTGRGANRVGAAFYSAEPGCAEKVENRARPDPIPQVFVPDRAGPLCLKLILLNLACFCCAVPCRVFSKKLRLRPRPRPTTSCSFPGGLFFVPGRVSGKQANLTTSYLTFAKSQPLSSRRQCNGH